MPWEIVVADSQVLAIHAALLGTGEVLYFGGDEHSAAHHDTNHINHTRLLDLATTTITVLSSPTTDVFCSGHAFLADGRLLVGGGTEQWGTAGDPNHPHALNFGGHKACWIYRPRARSWLRVRDMNFEPGRSTGGGRWYPTLVALSTGQVLAVSGHPSRTDNRHENNLPERYAALTDSWALLDATAADSAYYTRLFSLPDGNVFFATPVNGSNRIYNPSTRTFTGPAIAIPTDNIYHEWDATGVLLPLLPADGYKPRILLAGGTQPVRINLADASPAWANAGARQGAAAGRVRRYGLSVLLPTGEVFIAGGVSTVSPEVGVMEGETFAPGINWTTGTYTAAESWTSNDAAQVIRNYHSTALLLPNGRVWTAGSSKNANQGDPNAATIAERRIEVYKPPYDGVANRPTITSAPASISYGETFQVESPEAGLIQRVALIRCGSVTHAFDTDQRYVGVNFDHTGGTTLMVTAPPNSGVAPPGYYMLWLIDNVNRPCQMARFLRLAPQQCYIITDRSTFSTFEVDALLAAGPAARFTNAFYVVMDGFLPHEVGTPPTPPVITFTRPDSTPAPGITAEFYQTLHEDPAVPADTAQRITFAYTVRFDNNQAFAAIPGGVDSQTITLRATSGSHVCQAPITLTKNPNPYMRDGDVHWLSIDLRVLQMRPGMTRAGVTHGSGAGASYTFIQQLMAAFDAAPADDTHPFLSLSTDPGASQLELASAVNGQPVFNYAVAKVRYRAPAGAVSADNVRVFFRLFTTAVTGFEYNPSTTYRRFGDGANAAPLLGLVGGEIASIPFFAEARVGDMTAQPDNTNRKTLNPAGAAEAHAYFGCWLDFNQITERFPLHPSGDGPFAGTLKSIQELMRGNHQCLIAEIHYPPDPIPTGAGPGGSDNLSQRNLVIVESENPGALATHAVQHTFALKASHSRVSFSELLAGSPAALAAGGKIRADELMIRWGTVPRDAYATVYLPDVDVDELLAVAGLRDGPPVLQRVDEHTIQCAVGDVTFIPIPGGRTLDIPGLLTIQLPPALVKGQEFMCTVHQVSGLTQRVIGAFQITIPVTSTVDLLPTETRKLSVLRHIFESIPTTDHWHPVFVRYLGQIADRVRGLGGDPDVIEPAPDGSGGRPGAAPPVEDAIARCACRHWWTLAALVAFAATLFGAAPAAWGLPLAGAAIVFAVAVLASWLFRCRPTWCGIVTSVLFGLGIAGLVLGLALLLGVVGAGTARPAAAIAIAVGVLLIVAALRGCCLDCRRSVAPVRPPMMRPVRPPRVERMPVAPPGPATFLIGRRQAGRAARLLTPGEREPEDRPHQGPGGTTHRERR